LGEIVSASRRTDLPAWYGAWFLRRLREGSACARSPFSSRIYEVSLRHEDVVAFVFWTRDVLPFFPVLDRLDRAGYPYYFQYTLNGYPRDLEPAPLYERGLEGLLRLARRVGPARVVWRYDPILLAPGLAEADHARRFAESARLLAGSVDTVVVSFLDRYRKVERRLSRLELPARAPDDEEAVRLLLTLQSIARSEGIELVTCCEEGVRPPGIRKGACVDGDRIARLAPQGTWTPAPGPTREGCGCARSRDIGAYDSCPSGCAYCYAIESRESARRRFASHDPESALLLK
jgi:hypothetical protein